MALKSRELEIEKECRHCFGWLHPPRNDEERFNLNHHINRIGQNEI